MKATTQRTSLNFNKEKSTLVNQIDTLQENHSNYFFLTYVLHSKNIADKDIKAIQNQIIDKMKQQDKNSKILAFTVINKEELGNHFSNIHFHILYFTNKNFNKNKFYIKSNKIKQYKFKNKNDYEIKKASLGLTYTIDRHLILGAYNNIQFENFINVNELEDEVKFKFDKNLFEIKKFKARKIRELTRRIEALKMKIQEFLDNKHYFKISKYEKEIYRLESELEELKPKKKKVVISKSKLKIQSFVRSLTLLDSAKVGLKQLFKNIKDIWVANRKMSKFGVFVYSVF